MTSDDWANNAATSMLMTRQAALETAELYRSLGSRDPEGLVQLAADLASYTNRSVESTVELIRDAYGDVDRTAQAWELDQ